MHTILILGIIIFTGFILGKIVERFGLPEVSGFILAGILLNPDLFHIIPHNFVDHTGVVTDVSLAFITFSVGGTLDFKKLRATGKRILWITLLEAELAALFVALSFFALAPLFLELPRGSFLSGYLPFSLLIAALASPTDPSATLAVEHEYHAKGEVTSTIMEVAAFDDIMGIINFSVAVAFSAILVLNHSAGISSMVAPLYIIPGSILFGVLFGLFLNVTTKFVDRDTEGVLIVVIFSLLSLCFGIASYLGLDELLSTMSMGATVANFNPKGTRLFEILERYTEELIFVLFFTVSAMHLNFSVLGSNYLSILLFVVARALGKFSGTYLGALLSQAPPKVRKYTSGGLLPQGGIVIGLALIVKSNPLFHSFSDIIINVILGTTIIHEIIGPVASKFSLSRAGEISG